MHQFEQQCVPGIEKGVLILVTQKYSNELVFSEE